MPFISWREKSALVFRSILIACSVTYLPSMLMPQFDAATSSPAQSHHFPKKGEVQWPPPCAEKAKNQFRSGVVKASLPIHRSWSFPHQLPSKRFEGENLSFATRVLGWSMSTLGGQKARRGDGHKSMERLHHITRNQADSRPGWGHAYSRKGQKLGKPVTPSQLKDKQGSGRTRPTNNQLLYKAYFRWQHYPVLGSCLEGEMNLPSETDACASVTAAFLQVLHGLQEAECVRPSRARNILKLLAQDTRHTKVVDLACATHRVSEELKRHCLMDVDRQQYTTNLDRNRYGNDDQYMFTVIRYNLCLLEMCPCLVDVEVLDQKSNESILVSAGVDACMCQTDERNPFDAADKTRRSVSRSDRLDALFEAAARDTGNEASSTPGSAANNTVTNAMTKSKSISGQRGSKHQVSGGEVNSLQKAINAFQADPSFTDATRDSSKKPVPKRSFSSYHPTSKILDGSLGDVHCQWGSPETVEDNGRGVGNGTGEVHQLQDTAAVTGVKREREAEPEETIHWQQQRNYKLGKQSSSVGPRSATAAELKRLHAEVRQLCAEGRRTREDLMETRREMSAMASFKRDFDEDRGRWRKVESELQGLRTEVRRLAADRAASEEKSQQAESQLAANRQVINILLSRLQQLLMASQSMRVPGENSPSNSPNSPPTSGTEPGGSSTVVVQSEPDSHLVPLSAVAQVPTMPSQVQSNIMLAHMAHQLHNQLNATLIPPVHQVHQKHGPLLECGQEGLRSGPPARLGLTEAGPIHWGPSRNGLNMALVGGMDPQRNAPLQMEVPAVMVRDVDQVGNQSLLQNTGNC
ncbi:hypothetical protein BSKO_01351 [Bryopsis sp. KO-2023]|nr:hypothetical protein BSKO_01351 [Bryopsis sp. KO-2023]